MKKLILALVILISSSTFAQKANTTKDLYGNYIPIKKKADTAIPTGVNYITDDKTLVPVFKTSTGKLFIIKTSKKTGKQYKSYLRLQNEF